jgi:hypothetical protein
MERASKELGTRGAADPVVRVDDPSVDHGDAVAGGVDVGEVDSEHRAKRRSCPLAEDRDAAIAADCAARVQEAFLRKAPLGRPQKLEVRGAAENRRDFIPADVDREPHAGLASQVEGPADTVPGLAGTFAQTGQKRRRWREAARQLEGGPGSTGGAGRLARPDEANDDSQAFLQDGDPPLLLRKRDDPRAGLGEGDRPQFRPRAARVVDDEVRDLAAVRKGVPRPVLSEGVVRRRP